ncbi:MAG: hypothetical protein AUJ92_15820 [Armatimonadetes bacterium CG2_30_59_28]|nr:hypothetical protein [Armatimonadota bacterium]OIO91802.1 MAG: hypothetical protein AUJ92_15820 [Armatimonadetes bacterium CG2_30_59_28]PIU66637.1 MAG: hypothetical protein COS85_04105 [Armatimonadetes bacterium CG07_land_8_20_14_0_80_59_28]PIX40656.1 MAG: hypothetical protein COZ56_14225 [Armatimonadetes bacterium CG_4_8_14_3_um_filter_58_9]PIY38195.1 MAG: hypothetical protein COZ05_21195 [Armatimonadetes bacterium CG_4_10_14_3_um_filter_59_10]
MKVIDIKEASRPLADYAREASRESIVITENGKPTVGLFAFGEADWESVSLSMNPEFMELIGRSRVRHRTEGGIPADEMRRRLGLVR